MISINGAQYGQAEELFVKDFSGQTSNHLFLHLVNSLDHLLHGQIGVEIDLILRQSGHEVVRTLEAEQKIPFQLFFGGLVVPRF